MDDPSSNIQGLIEHLDAIRAFALALEHRHTSQVTAAHPHFRSSLMNLLDYLALRHTDLRTLQTQLGELGVSRLGRSESHVLASLQAVRETLLRLDTPVPSDEDAAARPLSFVEGKIRLGLHADRLLGPASPDRRARIMVTFPSEAADNYELVRDLLAAGMDCARINFAHDDEAAWRRMIEHVRRAERETGRSCKVTMDLCGPKLRIGPLVDGPRVVHLRPERDLLGRPTAACKVWLAPPDTGPPDDHIHLPVEAAWLDDLQAGEEVAFEDTRDKKRTLRLVARRGPGWSATLLKSAYVITGTRLTDLRGRTTRVGDLPPVQLAIRLQTGDPLIVHRAPDPGEPHRYDAEGRLAAPAHVSCTIPNVYTDVRSGEPILFDDGKIEGVVRMVSEEALQVEVIYTRKGGARLRGLKGINLPESNLRLQGLTEKDRSDLAFAVRHADVVNMSFVNDSRDVVDLYRTLDRLGAPPDFGVILKIETRRGVKHLPDILMTAMQRHPLGIMIARGDLAVECGWKYMAEVQEEVLCLCEAAHVPIVWATQVLETVAKKGRPSRAEISDAAMAQRAECVMLNKGPYILEAIHMLGDILTRMQEHQLKKAPMLPSLNLTELLTL